MTDAVRAVTDAYLADERIHHDGRPWMLLNMISSVDGAIAIDGLSGGLGNDADFAVFKTLRSLADVILVAAGTARAERYQVPEISDPAAAQRSARGQSTRPRLAVVTRSLRLDLESPLFSDPTYRPLVVTVDDAPPAALRALGAKADVLLAGTGNVDLTSAVAQLGTEVGPVVLAEGGPTLNAQLAAADLIDELCVTVSPWLVGGSGVRMLANGPHHQPLAYALDRATPAGGLLFTRYLRRR